jgi:hypothetical protein
MSQRGSIGMFFHPTINLEISRQRQHDLLADAERHRIVKNALAGSRPTREAPSVREPSTTTASRPQRATA